MPDISSSTSKATQNWWPQPHQLISELTMVRALPPANTFANWELSIVPKMELYKGRGAVCTPIYERNGLASVNQGRLQPTRTTTICTTYSEYAFLATTPSTHPHISHLMQNFKVQAVYNQPRQPPCAWHNYSEYACLLLPPPSHLTQNLSLKQTGPTCLSQFLFPEKDLVT